MMIKTTKAQRHALKRVYDRQPLRSASGEPLSYREFRKQLQWGYDCVMIRWAGMWLGIEPDGYTHS